MSEWKKIENPVASDASGNDADPLASGALAIPPHRPRKKRSDAGKKRAKPAPSAAVEGTPAAGGGRQPDVNQFRLDRTSFSYCRTSASHPSRTGTPSLRQ